MSTMKTRRATACAIGAAACATLAMPAPAFAAEPQQAPAGDSLVPQLLQSTITQTLHRIRHEIRAERRRSLHFHLDLSRTGFADIPADAPRRMRSLVHAANEINKTPYVYGGGHGSFNSSGYDCSGSVSYALHGAGVLDTPLASGSLESYGEPGPGRWVTIYANGGHAYMTVAGMRFDTSAHGQGGARWTTELRSNAGYVMRHPAGL